MKSIFLLLIFLFSAAFAEMNPLINTKLNNNSIVDIGTRDNIPKPGSSYVKTIQSFPALTRQVSHMIETTNRNINVDSCEEDKYGNETCSIGQVNCSSNFTYTDDIVQEHNGRISTPIQITTTNNPTTRIEYCYEACYQGFCGDRCFDTDDERTNNEILLVSGNGYINYDIVNQQIVFHIWENSIQEDHFVTSYSCPLGYYRPYNGTTYSTSVCYKDYTYYTYTCPTDLDLHGNPWEGPLITTGGDCQGIGILSSSGGVCPGQIPSGFSHNCGRAEHQCPFGDDYECLATAADSDDLTEDNRIGDYIYRLADSHRFTSRRSEPLMCPDNPESPACPPGWSGPTSDNKCKKRVMPSQMQRLPDEDHSIFAWSVSTGGFYFLENEKFSSEVEEVSPGVFNYITAATKGLDFSDNICKTTGITTCLKPTYTYMGYSVNKCYVSALNSDVCQKTINNVCYTKPTLECRNGFIFNYSTGKCERSATCTGTMTNLTDYRGNPYTVCVLPDSSAYCASNFSFDTIVPDKCARTFRTEPILEQTLIEPYTLVFDHFDIIDRTRWDVQLKEDGMQEVTYSLNVIMAPLSKLEFRHTAPTACDSETNILTVEGRGLATLDESYDCTNDEVKDTDWVLLADNNITNAHYSWAGANFKDKIYPDPDNNASDSDLTKLETRYYKPVFRKECPTDYVLVNDDHCEHYYEECRDNTHYRINSQQRVCYEYFGSTYTYDFVHKWAYKNPYCSGGTWNTQLLSCTTSPRCSSGRLINTTTGSICQESPTMKCDNSTWIFEDNSNTHSLFTINANPINNYPGNFLYGACKVPDPCGVGDTFGYISFFPSCLNEDYKTDCPEGFLPSEDGSNTCIAIPGCKNGWVREGNQCVINYSWYEYDCPGGWTGSNEIFNDDESNYKAGGNCFGSCGYNGCECNSAIAPANSCKFPIAMLTSSGSAINYIKQERPLLMHKITGDNLGDEEFNDLRHFACATNPTECMEGVNKIWGSGSSLCFSKKNKESTCFNVDGCYFNGIIDATTNDPGGMITYLKLNDPYTLINGSNYTVDKLDLSYEDSISGDDNKTEIVCVDHAASFIAFVDGSEAVIRLNTGRHNCDGNGYYDIARIPLQVGGADSGYVDINYTASCLGTGSMRINLNGDPVQTNSVCSAYGAQHPTVEVDYSYLFSRHVFNYSCPTGFYDPNDDNTVPGTCFPSGALNSSITSTCKMNGHVGWPGRSGPIVSVGNSKVIGKHIDFQVKPISGTAGVDFHDGTEWQNFNAATMAIQFSDGEWYVIANAISQSGASINRNLDPQINLLSNSNYIIKNLDQDGNETALDNLCKYKNQVLDPSMCGNTVTIITPSLDTYATNMTDIETFNELYTDRHDQSILDNDINLSIRTKTGGGSVVKLGAWSPTFEFKKDDTVDSLDENFSRTSDRLRFWDSYQDGFIGFLEFVREVKPSDRELGYIPEFFDYEELLGDGFTSIFLMSDRDGYLSDEEKLAFNNTYAIRFRPTSHCSAYAAQYGGTMISSSSFNTIGSASLYKGFGVTDPDVCIIRLNGIKTPSNSMHAVKYKSFTTQVAYKCSPYICNDDGTCGEVECKPGYTGSLLPSSVTREPGACISQKCDIYKPYVGFCGKYGECSITDISFEDSNGNCQEIYCNDGVLDAKTKTCKVETCPPGSTEDSNGNCIPN